jgi:predicted nucleic acid-binding protein
MILVDTSVWVKATQQKNGRVAVELDSLINNDEVATTDIVIAEVLQGTSTRDEFAQYAGKLDALHHFPMDRETWLHAAELSFDLRRRGLATPLTDLAIATVALDNDLEVYTTDSHFDRVPGLRIYDPSDDSAKEGERA